MSLKTTIASNALLINSGGVYTLLLQNNKSFVITRLHIDVVVQSSSTAGLFEIYISSNGVPIDTLEIAINNTQYTYTFNLGNSLQVYAGNANITLSTSQGVPASTQIGYTIEIQAYS